jgi:FAD/FMN-containing dehydrogenase/Fe-S oxidoreductase
MIPRLPLAPAPGAEAASFLDALRDAGFEGELSTADADRTVLATDNSVYEILPQAVAFPRGTGDLARVMRLLAEPRFAGVAIAPRGGGTGTNGQSLTDGIVVDVSRHMNRILEINPAEGWACVEAGVVKDQLNAALAPHGLFFAPELSTSNRATIGGMVSTDASGQGSCLYGKTRDHVLELTTVLMDGAVWRSRPLDEAELRDVARRPDRIGTIHRALDAIDREHRAEIAARFPKLNRCLSGYDLAHLRDDHGRFDLNAVLCGSEGTLGLLAEAKLRVLPIPRHVALVNLRYASFDAALRDARVLAAAGAASVETVDSRVLALARRDIVWDAVRDHIPDDADGPARGINLVEFVGHTGAELEAPLARLVATLETEGRTQGRTGHTVARGEGPVRALWEMRKRAVGLLGNTEGEARPVAFVEDTAVPPEHLADYIAEFRALLDARGLQYGMFGHVDAGVLHVRPALDMKAPGAEATLRAVTEEVVALTQRHGGLLWGEHGKGVRSEFSPRVFGPLYPLVQAVKAAFDPRNQLNPGKIATPGEGALLTVDGVPTRGAADRAIPPQARAAYAEAVHCNGNGACFTWDPDDAMCPSWKATRDRRHSPKGRAMLAKEWLRRLSAAGLDPVGEARRLRARAGWLALPGRIRATLGRRRGEDDFAHVVKAAMDGCLVCKSCAGGCPVKVNVPAFRARFLELYHARYLRPAKDHAVAALEHALPIAARLPRLHDAVVASPLGGAALRWLGLVDPPRLSGINLRREAARRGVSLATPDALARLGPEERARSVVLVQDAFTTHYETGLVLDTLDLLRLLGLTPWLAPYRPNGKALHVHGFLGRFERLAAQNAAMLRDLATTGVDLVGLDPSMTLTYRSEYAEALGAEAAPPILLLQEWLARRVTRMPHAEGGPYRLLPHCTEASTAAASLRDWAAVFARAGLQLDVLRAGCCGMAGTYGHEAEHRDTSARIYDLSWRRHLATPSHGEALATGFSCRSQAKRLDGAALHHPVTALLAALRVAGRPHPFPPERKP